MSGTSCEYGSNAEARTTAQLLLKCVIESGVTKTELGGEGVAQECLEGVFVSVETAVASPEGVLGLREERSRVPVGPCSKRDAHCNLLQTSTMLPLELLLLTFGGIFCLLTAQP